MKEFTGRERWKSIWRETKSLLLTVVILTAVRSAIADWNDLPTGSMNPAIVQNYFAPRWHRLFTDLL